MPDMKYVRSIQRYFWCFFIPWFLIPSFLPEAAWVINRMRFSGRLLSFLLFLSGKSIDTPHNR
jgi:hypothetical protein